MQNVSSYILTLVGTEAANPKEPQGDLYEPKADADGEAAETADSAAAAAN